MLFSSEREVVPKGEEEEGGMRDRERNGNNERNLRPNLVRTGRDGARERSLLFCSGKKARESRAVRLGAGKRELKSRREDKVKVGYANTRHPIIIWTFCRATAQITSYCCVWRDFDIIATFPHRMPCVLRTTVQCTWVLGFRGCDFGGQFGLALGCRHCARK